MPGSAILGTFLGGIAGSSRHFGPDRLAPCRTFVVWVHAPIFFATAGPRMDLAALGRPTVLGVAGAGPWSSTRSTSAGPALDAAEHALQVDVAPG